MRYMKGSKVEVLDTKVVPSGSWRSAEIICGNGHNYTVRYDMESGVTEEAVVERVSRKSIRPCPPPHDFSGTWVSGDVVEVFHNFSWKTATVSKVLGRNYFLVRLLGSTQEFKVHSFDLRMQQNWLDNKWVVIGKGYGGFEGRKFYQGSNLMFNQNMHPQAKTNRGMDANVKDATNYAYTQEPHISAPKIRKRRLPNSYSQVEAHARITHKLRVIEKEGRRYPLFATDQFLWEKVDAVASNCEMMGDKHVHVSFNNKINRLSMVDVEEDKPSEAAGCSHANRLESDDADNITCSVGSCSITSNNSFKMPCKFSRRPVEDVGDQFSDAESVCEIGYGEGNCFIPSQEELAAEIHRLELHAYRCTIEALHASGPLSWEKETLMTNLRLSLHISNDEHLMELRNLASTAISRTIS